MFVFDARAILTLPDVKFSDGNMQSGAPVRATETEFSGIPFAKVFHEGGLGGDPSIIYHRCAEVLAPSPLPLERYLLSVYCRSEAERVTLLHQLDEKASFWMRALRVSDDLQVFQKQFAFLERVSISKDGLFFTLNPRYDHSPLDVRVQALDASGRACVNVGTTQLPTKSAPNGPFQIRKDWHVKQPMAPGSYLVTIDIDSFRAFEAVLRIDEFPF